MKPKQGQLFNDSASVAEEIYSLYPRKVGRPVAIMAIKKALRKVSAEFLIDRTKKFAEIRNGDLSFVPNPATWFNQERFNDDPETWRPRNGSVSKPVVREKIDVPIQTL